jgi:hypothetical protein
MILNQYCPKPPLRGGLSLPPPPEQTHREYEPLDQAARRPTPTITSQHQPDGEWVTLSVKEVKVGLDSGVGKWFRTVFVTVCL